MFVFGRWRDGFDWGRVVSDAKLIDGTVYEHVSLEVAHHGTYVAGDLIAGGEHDGETVLSSGPILKTVAPGITGVVPRVFVGSVAFTNGTEHAEVSESKRTRWLWFVNRDGKPALAPGVRTHQLSLLFGMGLDWYKRAMAEHEAPRAVALGESFGASVAP